MKTCLSLLGLSLFLSSCFSVSFIEPQPSGGKNLESFPNKLLGKYVLDDDTVIVTPQWFTMPEDGEKPAFISDSVIVRKYKKYTVLNLKEKKVWTVILAKPGKSGDVSVFSIHDEDYADGRTCNKDSLVLAMQEICKVKKRGYEYFANPSKKEFNKLIKKGVIRPSGELRRIE